MKTNAFILSLTLLATILLSSCEKTYIGVIVPSPYVSTETYQITEFNDLDIADNFEVEVLFSDSENTLQIEANENLHSLIVVDQVNGRLSIHLKRWVPSITGSPVLKIYLTTPSIKTITAQGNTRFYLRNPWVVDQASVHLTGSSTFTGTIQAAKLQTVLRGASSLDLDGSVQICDVTATGASKLSGFAFEATNLTADLTGASELSMTIREELRVTATGASMIYYQGNAVITYQNLTGGSQIIKR